MRRLVGFFTLLFLLSSDCRPVLAEDSVHHTFRYLSSSGSPQTYQTMTFSPDSSQLAISVGGKVCFIDLKAGRETGEYDSSPFGIRYSKNGERIHLISTSGSSLVDTLTGEKIKFDFMVTPGSVGLALEKQSGKLLISRISPGGPVAAIDEIAVGDELLGLGEGRNGQLTDMAGRGIADATKFLGGPAGTYLRLKLLPRGQFNDQNAKTYVVRRQEAQTRGNELQFVKPRPVRIDDNLVWCVSNNRHSFRNAFTGQPAAFLQTIDVNNIGLYAISPDQQRFAVVANLRSNNSQIAVEVFDIATQDRLAYVPFPQDSYYDIAFAPDNNRVLVATWDSLEVLDVDKQEFSGRLDLGWKPAPPNGQAGSSDGSAAGAATESTQDDVGLTRRHRTSSPRRLVATLAISSKEIVATGDASGQVKLWDLNSGTLLQELPQNPEAEVDDVTFSPDGQWLAYIVKGILHVVDVSSVQRPTPGELTDHQGQQTSTDPSTSPSADPAAPNDTKEFDPIVGAEVDVRSRGVWYPAVIVRVDGEDRWQIHYEDCPTDWDELVTRPRLRPRSKP